MSAEASFARRPPLQRCLKQAGVPVDFVRLADIGIRGNGHFLMLEKNNSASGCDADWLDKHVTPSEGRPAKRRRAS